MPLWATTIQDPASSRVTSDIIRDLKIQFDSFGISFVRWYVNTVSVNFLIHKWIINNLIKQSYLSSLRMNLSSIWTTSASFFQVMSGNGLPSTAISNTASVPSSTFSFLFNTLTLYADDEIIIYELILCLKTYIKWLMMLIKEICCHGYIHLIYLVKWYV